MTTVFDVLEQRFRETLHDAQMVLQSAGAKDFAEYRDLCGYIRGIETALREVQDLARNYMEDDND